MADLTDVYAALQKADAAGDTAGAKQLADYIRAQQAPTVHSYDAINGQVVPTGSPAAIEARSPIAQPDQNDSHPVTAEISAGLENLRAGAGKYFVDLARGLGQKVGLVSYQDVQDSRARDAPLMSTLAGKAGNIGAGVLTTAPAMAIPGANTVAGAGAIGAVTGALQPAASTREALTNPLVGAAVGAGVQYVGNKIGQYATDRLAARQAASTTAASLNSDRDATFQAGRAAGYVAPPTAINPNATNTALESVSGKAATRQGASAKNQQITNAGVKEDLGIPSSQPVTRDGIRNVIAQKGAIYPQVENALGNFQSDAAYTSAVKGLTHTADTVEASYPGIGAQANQDVQKLATSLDVPGHNGKDAVGLFKLLNERAKDNFQAASNGGDSQLMSLARAQKAAADEVGDLITRQLTKTGQADLANQWQNARTIIAKGYQALGALKGNDVSAQVLAAQLRKGKLVTGKMGLAARFADQFPDAMQLPKSGVGVSKLGAVGAAVAGSAGLYAHNPAMIVPAVAAAAAPYATRGAILSGIGQRALATPNYAPNALGTLALRGLEQAPNVALPLGLQAPRLAQGQ